MIRVLLVDDHELVRTGFRHILSSDPEIVSPKTVSTYRHRLFEKLQVGTDVGLTHLALRHGLIGN
jgi:DNA-binding NarL/FixJ family response regulator